MEHTLRLQPRYFEYIKIGTKRIELRLYDEKRKLIKVGDTINFIKEDETKEELKVKVKDLLIFKNFEELFENYTIEILADNSMTKEELLTELEKFYTKEKQKEYNVIGILIEL